MIDVGTYFNSELKTKRFYINFIALPCGNVIYKQYVIGKSKVTFKCNSINVINILLTKCLLHNVIIFDTAKL